jgi:hypothetical protein
VTDYCFLADVIFAQRHRDLGLPTGTALEEQEKLSQSILFNRRGTSYDFELRCILWRET